MPRRSSHGQHEPSKPPVWTTHRDVSAQLSPRYRPDRRVRRGVAGRAGQGSFQRCEQLEHCGRFEDAVALLAEVSLDEDPCLGEAVDCGPGGDV